MEGKCSVGIHDGTTCSNIKRKKTDTLQLESIHNLKICLHSRNVTSSKELLDKVCQICYQSGRLEDRYAKYASNA